MEIKNNRFKTYICGRNFPFMSKNIAVIDLGTNTFHLVIAEVKESGFTYLYKEKVPVKVGEGGIDHGIITEPAKARAIETLTYFRTLIDKYNVETVRAMATSAFRNASNTDEIVAEVLAKTGIQIEVIHGIEEARYIFKGVSDSLELPDSNSLIIDIGGGSVEFVLCNSKEVIWERSFEIGGQRLMNRFHQSDPMTEDDRSRIIDFLKTALISLETVCKKHKPENLIGASGSFDTLMDVANGGENSNPDAVSFQIDEDTLQDIMDDLIHKTTQERRAIPGMIEMRVQMIVVASVLIQHVLTLSPFKNIFTSRYALKEGVLLTELDSTFISE